MNNFSFDYCEEQKDGHHNYDVPNNVMFLFWQYVSFNLQGRYGKKWCWEYPHQHNNELVKKESSMSGTFCAEKPDLVFDEINNNLSISSQELMEEPGSSGQNGGKRKDKNMF